MSRIIASAAIRGAHTYVEEAEARLTETLESKGGATRLEFPNTAFHLPLILALTGLEVNTVEEAQKPLQIARDLLSPVPTDAMWLPYLGDTLDAGIATLIAQEVIEALRYANGTQSNGIYLGFTDDAILRTQGIKLVDGRMPGFAACVGAMPTTEEAVRLARELQEQSILVFLASHTGGVSMAEQLAEAGVEMSWDTYLVPYGTCPYEHVVGNVTHEQLVPKAIEVRGLKLKISKIPIPVSYSAAFEGERVRKEQLHVEFGRQLSPAFEFLRGRELPEVEDGKIEVIGPDLDTAAVGGVMPLGILIDVAGRKLQKDFEPILERQIHRLLNGAMGVMHIGQRDMPWIRISQDTFKAGFRLRHFGDILHAKFHEEYPALVDKVAVTIYSEPEQITRIIEDARKVWDERDARVAGMTDETVDVFYSCTLCQSYVPNHVCVITPERLGLCGAYNWLDGKASYEINPSGPNQPVEKGACVDPSLGVYEGINQFVLAKSNKPVEQVSLYSMIQSPMTSCGCFERIMGLVPEVNGVIVVNREYSGMTPVGMTFSTLAGLVGGGVQTPGFLGVGRLYMISRKFIPADGGLHRLVWMPKELKEALHDRLVVRAKELGDETFVDKIADETVAITVEELTAHLERVGHPAMAMPALL